MGRLREDARNMIDSASRGGREEGGSKGAEIVTVDEVL